MQAKHALSVLHVAQPIPDGGVPRWVGTLARDQAQRGFRVTVACPSESFTEHAAADARVSQVRWQAARDPGPSIAIEAFRLAQVVGAAKPDIVHLHSSKAGVTGRLAVRGRIPTVFQPHSWSFDAAAGVVEWGAVTWERLAARWASAIVCVSEAERSRGETVGINGTWRVIANGVDLERFSAASDSDRGDARAQLGLNNSPLVLCIGRLSHQKGQNVLLRAWPLVLKAVPSAQLVLIGEGPERAKLELLATQSVRFEGVRDDVDEWLAAADVVVLPSRWEGMALTMLEAMARCRTVVSTDVAGAREALDGGAGAIVPIDDELALAAALAERLNDHGLAASEGATGRERAEERYDIRRAKQAVADLYLELARS